MSEATSFEDRLADFTVDWRMLVVSLMAVVVGAFSAGVAYALVWLIAVFTNLAYYQRLSAAPAAPAGHHLGYWSVLVPVAGGLIVGLVARYGSPKIRGHGIPEALEAILIGRSRIEPAVAVLKPISSALAIGTGGPFGAEGPIIMTGGALGSLFAQFFRLTSAERKTLLVAGAAAGMSAIFAAPVSAVMLAIELLLFEWKPRSFIPVAIASAVAAVLREPLLGRGPVFPAAAHATLSAETLGFALVLGVVVGFGSSLITTLLYWVEDLFKKLPIHWMWWPAIGGLAVGLGGLVEPRVLGVGYETIAALLRGEIIGAALVGLLVGKSLVWALALGSGTSGGVLAPLLIMGGALGALLARWIPVGDTGLWALLGMAAMMGGTMSSPLTGIIFTLEVTHDLNALPGIMIATIAAEAVTVLIMRRSIMTEKVARRGHHITREYTVDPLDIVRVGEIMDRNVPTIPASLTVSELAESIARGDPRLAQRQGTPIVDPEGYLVGIITRSDVLQALEADPAGAETVFAAGNRDPIVAYPDEPMRYAVDRMLRNEIGRLPVVARDDPQRLLGYLGRAGVMLARLQQMKDEGERESSLSIRNPLQRS